jgi:uncharacterized protein YecE (DUF72 family)
MVRFWVGVSGFSYSSWKGVFYPEGTRPDQMLEAYSNKLNSVEINSSFYHTPTKAVTSKWAQSTNADFRFSFKANRRITHIKKLHNVDADSKAFFGGIEPVGEKLGCVLVQLPPYMKQDYDLLDSFLAAKPKSVKVTLEFRHGSWFGQRLKEILSRHNAALCVADSEDMEPEFEQTADFTYARLRRDSYSRKELQTWAEKLSKFAQGSNDSFVYFKHDETGDAANKAAEFNAILGH